MSSTDIRGHGHRRADRAVEVVHLDDYLNPRATRYRLGRRSPEGYFVDTYDLDAFTKHVLEPARRAPRAGAAGSPPWGSSTSRTQQIDHTVPFRHGAEGPAGQSRVGNYGPMTQHHHRIKTHGAWEVQQPFAGIYVWRDPHGATYLVDHTGTRRLGAAATSSSPGELHLGRELLGLAA